MKIVPPGLIIFLWTAIALLSCKPTRPSPDHKPLRTERMAMGTVAQVTFYSEEDAVHTEPFFEELVRLENLFSRHIEDSDIHKVNAAAGRRAVQVSPEVMEVMTAALVYYRKTGGLFDPTIAPLVDLWGIGTEHPSIPTESDISSISPLIGCEFVKVDSEAGTLYLPQSGMELDLGGIAKGYVTEYLAGFLTDRGVTSAIINLGGNVRVIGSKPDGSFYRIAIQDPLGPKGRSIGSVTIKDGSVVTSGVYERFFERDGVRYHHILDPKTGQPSETGLLSVTILTKSGLHADALSTAVFLMGPEKGMTLIKSIPETECLIITREGELLATAEAARIFSPEKETPYDLVIQ